MQPFDISFFIDGIMAVEWSASNEWVVMTGGCDSAIRFWDIRRPGCFRILDRVQSLPGRRLPIYERAINEVSKMCYVVNAHLVKWFKVKNLIIWVFVLPQTLMTTKKRTTFFDPLYKITACIDIFLKYHFRRGSLLQRISKTVQKIVEPF